jgi:hypothetical protein
MKCFNHNASDAVAVCFYCGKGLCADCARPPQMGRVTCSTACAGASSRADAALQTLLQQGRRGAQASAIYCFLGTLLSGVGAVAAWYMLPSPFLILFAAGCAFVLLLSGVWYARAASKQLTR